MSFLKNRTVVGVICILLSLLICFGLTPLYLGFADVWQAVEHLCQIMDSGEWRDEKFNQKNAVT